MILLEKYGQHWLTSWPPSGCMGDDTTVPVLAKGKTVTERCWTHVGDDRPFWQSGAAGSAILLLARPLSGEHPDSIWRAGAASCRPTLMATARGTTPNE